MHFEKVKEHSSMPTKGKELHSTYLENVLHQRRQSLVCPYLPSSLVIMVGKSPPVLPNLHSRYIYHRGMILTVANDTFGMHFNNPTVAKKDVISFDTYLRNLGKL